MKVKRRETVTLFTLYGAERPEELVNALRDLGSEVEFIACSGVLRPAIQFPYIKDERGRPYYGKEGIQFYLNRKKRI